MKPVRLVIEGINSFTDAQELDFEAVGRSNLFCIAGKTGAGKTTIFDSIMLALYGKTNKGNLADVVNLSRMTGSVTFEFTADGATYRAERIVKCKYEKAADGTVTGRRNGNSEITLYKDGEMCAFGDAATEQIRKIIGLAESEFKNVYLLEQGEYADFLKKPPAKQLEAVGKIFDLMRFSDIYKRAGEKQRALDAEISAQQRLIDDIGEVTKEDVRVEKNRIASVKGKGVALVKEAEKLKAELDEMEKTHDIFLTAREKQKTLQDLCAKKEQANDRLVSAETELTAFSADGKESEYKKELDGLRTSLTQIAALNALDRQYFETVELYGRKKDALEKIKNKCALVENSIRDLTDAEENSGELFDEAVEKAVSAAGNTDDVSEVLTRAVAELSKDRAARVSAVSSAYYELCAEKNAYDEIKAQFDAEIALKEKAETRAGEELGKTEMYAALIKENTAALGRARQEEENAKRALDSAKTASHAAAVRAGLKAGDICPVCGGVYNGGTCESEDVDKCKAECDRTVAARVELEKKGAELDRLIEKAKDEYNRVDGEKRGHEAKAQELKAKAIGTKVDPQKYAALIKALEKARSCAEKYASARSALDAAAPQSASAGAEMEGALTAFNECEEKLSALKTELGDMSGKTDEKMLEIKEKIEKTENAAKEREKRKTELVTERDGARSAVQTLTAAIESVRGEAMEIPEFDEDGYKQKRDRAQELAAGIAKCDAEATRLTEELSALEQKCERVKKLKAELAEMKKRSDMYGTIAEMTKGKAMLDFVATEYIEDFTAAASDILGSLSAGKYSMYYDRDDGFVVADYLNEGKARKTDTLSGGELFLASLSVAIAIARSQGGGDNAFFFLDEGFGTLDEDLIDTVYGALEDLSKTCLVGVISHSSELISRMPSCVEVIEAADGKGSTIKY